MLSYLSIEIIYDMLQDQKKKNKELLDHKKVLLGEKLSLQKAHSQNLLTHEKTLTTIEQK